MAILIAKFGRTYWELLVNWATCCISSGAQDSVEDNNAPNVRSNEPAGIHAPVLHTSQSKSPPRRTQSKSPSVSRPYREDTKFLNVIHNRYDSKHMELKELSEQKKE